MKKILIFSTAYYPAMSGAEIAVDEITKKIGDMEFDLITARFSRKNLQQEKYNNVNIYRVGFGTKTLDKFLLPFLGYLKAKKLHQKNNYNIAWSLMASQASIAASFFKKKFPQIKLLLTLQEGDDEEYLTRYTGGNKFLYKILIRPWHLLVFRRANYVTAISHYLKERALANGVDVPISIIPNGVDINKFSQKISPEELDDLKQELGKKEGDIFLVQTGRLNYKNALDDVIKALPYLPENIKFLQIGRGEELEKLKNLAKKEGVEKRVIFIDFLEHKEMVKYLQISDIFIRPSLSEGLGNSFLEAMIVGLPVIATPVGGIPDFLHDNQTGVFCQIRNPESIANKVKELVNDRDSRKIIIKQARELVKERYNWEKIAQDMKNIFNRLTKSE